MSRRPRLQLPDAERMGIVWRILVAKEKPLSIVELMRLARGHERFDLGGHLRRVAYDLSECEWTAAAEALVDRKHLERTWRSCDRCEGACCRNGEWEYRPAPGMVVEERETA